jgi:hypothetical protein
MPEYRWDVSPTEYKELLSKKNKDLAAYEILVSYKGIALKGKGLLTLMWRFVKIFFDRCLVMIIQKEQWI